MGEVVDLRGRSIPLEDDEFIENLARFADGTLTEAAVKAKYHLSEEEWAALGYERQARRENRGMQKFTGYEADAPKGKERKTKSSMHPQFSPE